MRFLKALYLYVTNTIIYSSLLLFMGISAICGYFFYEYKTSEIKQETGKVFIEQWLNVLKTNKSIAYENTTDRFKKNTIPEFFSSYVDKIRLDNNSVIEWVNVSYGKNIKDLSEYSFKIKNKEGAISVVMTVSHNPDLRVDSIDVGETASSISKIYKDVYRGQYGAGNLFKNGISSFYSLTSCREENGKVIPLKPSDVC